MQDGSDAVARGARVVRLDRTFRWPGGRHLAVVLNVAYEGWSDGKAPGIGPMGNPLPAGAFDTNALSWGSYGATRGIERLLRVLDRAKRSASVMVSGVFGERTPATVRAIVQAGHELVAHCYAQDVIPAQLAPERIAKPDVQKLLRKVQVRPDESFTTRYPSETPSRITVRLTSGKSYTHEVNDYPGFATRPFTWDEIVAKLDDLAADRADEGLRKEIAAAVRSLESIRVKDLMNLLDRVD